MACRLCLHVFTCNSKPVRDLSWKYLLPNILPQVMLELSTDPSICEECSLKLQEHEIFRGICKKAEETVSSYVNAILHSLQLDSGDLLIDLEDVLLHLEEITEKTGQPVCRICFENCGEESFSLSENNIYEVFVKSLFLEPILQNVQSPILCKNCADKVEEMYLFQQMCLDVENMLQDYASNETLSEEAIVEFAKDIGHILKEDGGSSTETSSSLVNPINMEITNMEISEGEIMACGDLEGQQLETEEVKEERQDENRNFLNGSISPSDAKTTKVSEPLSCAYSDTQTTKVTDPFTCSYSNNKVTNVTDPFTCPYCGFVVKNKCYLKEHIYVKHTPQHKLHECPKCDFKTKLKRYLRAHIRSQHSSFEETQKCPECSFETKLKVNLSKHMRLQHQLLSNNEELFCSLCKFKTRKPDAMRVHIDLEHGTANNTVLENDPEPDAMRVDVDLEYGTANNIELENDSKPDGAVPDDPEILQGTMEVQYYDECSESLSDSMFGLVDAANNDAAEMHPIEEEYEIVFKTGPPFQCSMCDYKTKRKHDMKRHIYNLHSKVFQLFTCMYCSYNSKSKDNLQKHLKYKHYTIKTA